MLFTGHGDAGYTSIIGGPALLKCDVRLEALGALDEAQAYLGLSRALLAESPWAESLMRVQSDLCLLMSECATAPHPSAEGMYLTEKHVRSLEDDLAAWEDLSDCSGGFVTPGNTIPGAHLHLARTTIRRAERHVVALHRDSGLANPAILAYLNRLSSWAYALALIVEASCDTTPPAPCHLHEISLTDRGEGKEKCTHCSV